MEDKTARNRLIRQLYHSGETLADLSRRFGISRSRVHQIITHTHPQPTPFCYERHPDMISRNA